MDCDNCSHRCFVGMVQRGVMDCDPPEEYCELDNYEFYNDDFKECKDYKYTPMYYPDEDYSFENFKERDEW